MVSEGEMVFVIPSRRERGERVAHIKSSSEDDVGREAMPAAMGR
jgi:hypothetical protein